MFFAVDHLVFAATVAEKERFAKRLERSGFVRVPGRLRFDEIGAHSESLTFEGGGFVEFVYEVQAGRAPRAWFAAEVPRLIGIGLASDDFENDVSAWTSLPGSWVMNEAQVLEHGSSLQIHAAGPHQHLSRFYVFAMDRASGSLEYPELGAEARLTRLTFAGSQAERWRERLTSWFGFQHAPAGLQIGGVALDFETGHKAQVRVTPTFGVRDEPGEVSLAAGFIELVARVSQPSSG